MKNRETYAEGNNIFYYEIPLRKDLNVIKSRGFRIRFRFEFKLCVLALGRILDFLTYSTNIYWAPTVCQAFC